MNIDVDEDAMSMKSAENALPPLKKCGRSVAILLKFYAPVNRWKPTVAVRAKNTAAAATNAEDFALNCAMKLHAR